MRTVFRIALFPVALMIDVFTWICVGLLSCSAFVFSLASTILGVLAFTVMLTCSLANGLILLGFAFLVSPIGLPMVATWMLSGLQAVSLAMKGI